MRRARHIIALIACIAPAGCQPRSSDDNAPINGTFNRSGGTAGRGEAASQAAWPFWPTRLRIHPSTRLTRDQATGKDVIEARIEFFDRDNASTKAVGQLTLQLASGTGNPNKAEIVETWNQDLRDLAVNQRQYDVITRTYLFRLRLESGTPPDNAELQAYFLSANGLELQETIRLRR